MLELFVFGITMVMVAMAGLPLVDRLVRGKFMSTPMAPPQARTKGVLVRGQGFTPLDMGPMPIDWPSETQDTRPKRLDLTWPSAGWSDDPFNSKHLSENAERANAAIDERALNARIRTAPSAPAASASRADAQATKPAPRERRSSAERLEREARAVAAAAEEAEQAARAAYGEAPDPAELRAMLKDLGLAKTVRAVMQRTGWDLDTVAAYIASARKR